jgi:hypothetical protein
MEREPEEKSPLFSPTPPKDIEDVLNSKRDDAAKSSDEFNTAFSPESCGVGTSDESGVGSADIVFFFFSFVGFLVGFSRKCEELFFRAPRRDRGTQFSFLGSAFFSVIATVIAVNGSRPNGLGIWYSMCECFDYGIIIVWYFSIRRYSKLFETWLLRGCRQMSQIKYT